MVQASKTIHKYSDVTRTLYDEGYSLRQVKYMTYDQRLEAIQKLGYKYDPYRHLGGLEDVSTKIILPTDTATANLDTGEVTLKPKLSRYDKDPNLRRSDSWESTLPPRVVQQIKSGELVLPEGSQIVNGVIYVGKDAYSTEQFIDMFKNVESGLKESQATIEAQRQQEQARIYQNSPEFVGPRAPIRVTPNIPRKTAPEETAMREQTTKLPMPKPVGTVHAVEQPTETGAILNKKAQEMAFEAQYRTEHQPLKRQALSLGAAGLTFVGGILGAVRHPIKTIGSMVNPVEWVRSGKAIIQKVESGDPTFVGDVAAAYVIGKGTAGLAKVSIPKFRTLEIPVEVEEFSKYQDLTPDQVKAGLEFHHTDYAAKTGKILSKEQHQMWHDINEARVLADTPELQKFYVENQITVPKPEPTIKVNMIGYETKGGRAVILISSEGTHIGTPKITAIMEQAKPGQVVRIGSALETKVVQKFMAELPAEKVISAERAKEFIPTAQIMIRETRSVKVPATEFPKVTERLPEVGVKVVLEQAQASGGRITGSFSRGAQLAKEYNIGGEPYKLTKVPADIDVHLEMQAVEIEAVTRETIVKFREKGLDARLAKGTVNAIEVKQPSGEFMKAVEFLNDKELLPEGETKPVPDFVVGIEKVGKSIEIQGTKATSLAEELRGVTQGAARLQKTAEGKFDIFPEEHRVKDIGSISVSARSLAQKKTFPGKLNKAIDKFEGMYPEELVRTQVEKVTAEGVKVELADFSKSKLAMEASMKLPKIAVQSAAGAASELGSSIQLSVPGNMAMGMSRMASGSSKISRAPSRIVSRSFSRPSGAPRSSSRSPSASNSVSRFASGSSSPSRSRSSSPSSSPSKILSPSMETSSSASPSSSPSSSSSASSSPSSSLSRMSGSSSPGSGSPTPPPPVSPIIPSPIPSMSDDKNDKVKGFNVYMKEHGKTVKANDKPLPKKEAEALGRYVADNTVSASFHVTPTKFDVPKSRRATIGTGAAPETKFTESRKNKGWFNEKVGNRIDTVGEKKGLSAAQFINAMRREATAGVKPGRFKL